MQALISYIVEDCIYSEQKEFDFLAGDEDYKMRFADSHRNIVTVKLFNQTFQAKMYRRLQGLRKAVWKQATELISKPETRA